MRKTGEVISWLSALITIVMMPSIAGAVDYDIGYEASLTASTGSGDFAPSYLMANNHGVLTQPNSTTLRLMSSGELNLSDRFTLCFAVDVIGGYASETDYQIYDTETESMVLRSAPNAPVWIQQLYAELAYRSVFLSLGMKEEYSVLVNQDLSSGDLCFSGNARPMPGVLAGFVDFQDIPLTKGWIQVIGAVGYYASLDENWMKDRYNYYNYYIAYDYMMHYKYMHLRTNPDKKFCFTIGCQSSCMIGGINETYKLGALTQKTKTGIGLEEVFTAFIPGPGGETEGDKAFCEGNHLGTWDTMLRYRFNNDDELMIYYQSLWEDGSGIGKLNGFDGLYGIEYSGAYEGIIEGVVIEYLDLTNQSGAVHYDPEDHENGDLISSDATGADDYYNNYAYCGYQYYGMALGSPFVRTAIYNTDGYMRITDNRIRAFHIGLQGHIGQNLSYRAKFGYRKSWGTPYIPLSQTRSATSTMLELSYDCPFAPGLSVKAQFGTDRGELVGDNTGGLVTISYNGLFGKK